MFKKYYKAANDDIQPNRELIDQIFEKAEKGAKVFSWNSVYKYGATVAAVLVLAISAYSYKNITDFKEPDLSNIVSEQTMEKDTEIIVNDIKTEEKNTATEVDSGKKENIIQNEIKENNEKVSPQSVEKLTEKTNTRNAESVNEIAQSEVSEANETEALENLPEENSNNGRIRTASVGAGEVAIWNTENYSGYLGLDIKNGIDVPDDMQYVSEDEFYLIVENGIPIEDTVMFGYRGENDRSINIYTSKLGLNSERYESNQDAKVLEVNGVKCYVISVSPENYNAYLKVAGVDFEIHTNKIEYDELQALVESISRLNN